MFLKVAKIHPDELFAKLAHTFMHLALFYAEFSGSNEKSDSIIHSRSDAPKVKIKRHASFRIDI